MNKEDQERLEFIIKQAELGIPIQLNEYDEQLINQLEVIIKLNQSNFGNK